MKDLKLNGFCLGESFRKWLESVIYKYTRVKHLTFGELKYLINK